MLVFLRRTADEASSRRGRVTARLRDRVGTAVTRSNRAVSDVASEYDLSWNTVPRVLVVAAAALTEPTRPTAVFGVNETEARSVR